jgi:catalase
MVANLAEVDTELASLVAASLGLTVSTGRPLGDAGTSPALSIAPAASGPIVGRVIGVLVTAGFDSVGVAALRKALERAGAVLHVIAPHGGSVKGAGRASATADATVFNADSVVYDALVVAGGVTALDPKSATMLQEAYRHHKTLAAWGSGIDALTAASIDVRAAGVITQPKATKAFTDSVIDALGWHRHWDR